MAADWGRDDMVVIRSGWLLKSGPAEDDSDKSGSKRLLGVKVGKVLSSLTKLGAFRKRFFVLDNQALMYYSTAKREGLKGFVALSDIVDVRDSDRPDLLLGFDVITSSRVFVLLADTQEAKDGWKVAIQSQLKSRRMAVLQQFHPKLSETKEDRAQSFEGGTRPPLERQESRLQSMLNSVKHGVGLGDRPSTDRPHSRRLVSTVLAPSPTGPSSRVPPLTEWEEVTGNVPCGRLSVYHARRLEHLPMFSPLLSLEPLDASAIPHHVPPPSLVMQHHVSLAFQELSQRASMAWGTRAFGVESALDLALRHFGLYHVNAGEVLCRKGDVATCAWLLLDGTVTATPERVSRSGTVTSRVFGTGSSVFHGRSSSDPIDTSVLIDSIAAPAVIELYALVHRTTYLASVKTHAPSLVASISYSALAYLQETLPIAASGLMVAGSLTNPGELLACIPCVAAALFDFGPSGGPTTATRRASALTTISRRASEMVDRRASAAPSDRLFGNGSSPGPRRGRAVKASSSRKLKVSGSSRTLSTNLPPHLAAAVSTPPTAVNVELSAERSRSASAPDPSTAVAIEAQDTSADLGPHESAATAAEATEATEAHEGAVDTAADAGEYQEYAATDNQYAEQQAEEYQEYSQDAGQAYGQEYADQQEYSEYQEYAEDAQAALQPEEGNGAPYAEGDGAAYAEGDGAAYAEGDGAAYAEGQEYTEDQTAAYEQAQENAEYDYSGYEQTEYAADSEYQQAAEGEGAAAETTGEEVPSLDMSLMVEAVEEEHDYAAVEDSVVQDAGVAVARTEAVVETRVLSPVVSSDDVPTVSSSRPGTATNSPAVDTISQPSAPMEMSGNRARLSSQDSDSGMDDDGAPECETELQLQLARLRCSLAALFRLVMCNAGTIIFRDGDEGDCVYVIVQGAVSLTAMDPAGIPLEIAVLYRGSCIGERALVKPCTRTYRATAITKCVLMRLTHASLRKVLVDCPHLWDVIEEALEQRSALSLLQVPPVGALFRGAAKDCVSLLSILADLFQVWMVSSQIPSVKEDGTADDDEAPTLNRSGSIRPTSVSVFVNSNSELQVPADLSETKDAGAAAAPGSDAAAGLATATNADRAPVHRQSATALLNAAAPTAAVSASLPAAPPAIPAPAGQPTEGAASSPAAAPAPSLAAMATENQGGHQFLVNHLSKENLTGLAFVSAGNILVDYKHVPATTKSVPDELEPTTATLTSGSWVSDRFASEKAAVAVAPARPQYSSLVLTLPENRFNTFVKLVPDGSKRMRAWRMATKS